MSYLALARKWRPTKFNEVVGQAHVLTALENALSQNRLHHAYLFSGTRGVGKTTIGRLFAKGLNCETGITATPCGECLSCKEIDEGRFVDLLEIDAASRTKVEDTRELLDNVQYKPARGRFKVYLIDEVHMLSRHSFNALLKTLEEPPEYVKFLLATTDPQKLPMTILSRCLQFHLKPIDVDTIHQQLDHILAQESVTAEARALGMISHAADGSMRDALSLTDQAIALGNGNVDTDTVSHMLGTLDTDQALHLLEAISSKQPQAAMENIQALAKNGVEWDGLLQQLSAQLHRIAMYQALPGSLDMAQPDAEKVQLLSQALSPQDVQLYYQIALKGREDLPLSPSERIGLEMIVLRMLAFRPANAVVTSAISAETSAPQAVQPVNTPDAKSQIASPSVTSSSAISAADTLAKNASQRPAMSSQQVQANTQVQANALGRMQPQPQEQPQAQPHVQQQPQIQAQPLTSQSNEQREPQTNQPPEYDDYANRDYDGASDLESYHSQDMQPMLSEPAAMPSALASSPPPVSKNPVSGLRHQLRSQRKGLNATTSTPSTGAKKPRATPAKKESVLDRVAQKHSGTSPVSPMPNVAEGKTDAQNENEPYRWKASKPVVQEKKSELTPTQLKKALEHIKTPEMAEKLVQESIEQDEWTALIAKLTTAKLVEQLALNSSYKKNGTSIELELRASQGHLNTDKAQSELLQALNAVLGEECHLTVQIGESGTTPLELRDSLYQGKLQQAVDSLDGDSNVQFIQKRFAAELDRDSVRPI